MVASSTELNSLDTVSWLRKEKKAFTDGFRGMASCGTGGPVIVE